MKIAKSYKKIKINMTSYPLSPYRGYVIPDIFMSSINTDVSIPIITGEGLDETPVVIHLMTRHIESFQFEENTEGENDGA